jgi:RimJ/RimL family protein N-acetyltransferase
LTTAAPQSDPSRVVLRPIDLTVARAVLRNRRSDDWSPGYPAQADRELCELLVQRYVSDETANGEDLELFSPHQVIFMGRVVGSVGCHRPPGADGSVEIGCGLVPELQGRGLATVAVAVLARKLFEAGIAAVLACTEQNNLASQAVLRHNNFQIAGEGRGGSILWCLTSSAQELG